MRISTPETLALAFVRRSDGSPAANTTHPGSTTILCNPSSNDNVTTLETLHFVFNQAAVINGIWFNSNHDTDFSLLGDKITIGGLSHTFLPGHFAGDGDWLAAGPYSVAAGTTLDIEFVDEQFYVSKMDVSAVPDAASASLLMGVSLFGLALMRRRLNTDLS